MRTRFILPLSIILLVVALTMGVAAAGAPPYPPDVHGGGSDAVDREGDPADLTAEEQVSSSGSVLFFLILPPITTVAFTDEEIGLTVDNRQEH